MGSLGTVNRAVRSISKNDGQNILTPVLAVTTAHMGVTTP